VQQVLVLPSRPGCPLACPGVNGSFSTAHTSELTGMSGRQLRYLAERGVLSPSARKAPGRGASAFYSLEDLFKLSVLQQVREAAGADLPIERLLMVAGALDRADLTEVLLLDATGAWTTPPEHLADTLTQTQAFVAVGLSQVDRALKIKIGKSGVANAALKAA
jgi:DNA-binding transcriptional MerR regulator